MRRRLDRELAEEIASHLQLHIDDNVRAGMTPAEARRAALVRFGGVEAAKERYRDRARIPPLENVARDLRHGLRSLLRTPWYSATVIAVVALSMTLASTVFAVVDGVLFKPPPYPDAEQLYVVSAGGYAASVQQVREWAAAVPEVQLATYQYLFTLGAVGKERPRQVRAAGIGPSFLSVIGVTPLFGGFVPEHFVPSNGRVPALISYQLWHDEFAWRRDVLGSRLDVAGGRNHMGTPLAGFQVAGVLPKDFVFPDGEGVPDVLIPIALSPEREADRNSSLARAVARVPPSVQIPNLRQRLDSVAATQGFSPETPGEKFHVVVDPVLARLRLLQRQEFELTFAMAAVIVALACVNVSGLGVARRRQRGREYAMRRALGASDWQLTRLTVCEVIPPVVVGTGAGLVFAIPVMHTVLRLMPPYVVLMKTPVVDWRVVAFSGGAATMAAVIAGLGQYKIRSIPLSEITVRGETVTPRRGWMGSCLAAAQVGLALVLTVGGVLLVSSLWLAWQQDTGYQHEQVAVLDLSFGTGTSDELASRAETVMKVCRDIGGVDQVAMVGSPFMGGGYLSRAIRRPPGALPGREQALPITADFFSMMGLTARQGRLPSRAELAGHMPVTVVSERVARNLWPGQSPIGKTLTSFQGDHPQTVIGVVRDVRYSNLEIATYGQIYQPFFPRPGSSLFMHGRAPAAETLRVALQQVRTIPGVGVLRATTMTEALGASIQIRAFRAWLFGGFALVALCVAGVGIFGLTAMSTACRTREIGLRFALGATRLVVVGSLLRERLAAVCAGLVGGGLVAAWAVRFLKSYLYQFTSYDLRLWAIAVSAVILTACAGVLVPAWRVSRVDPMTALRSE